MNETENDPVPVGEAERPSIDPVELAQFVLPVAIASDAERRQQELDSNLAATVAAQVVLTDGQQRRKLLDEIQSRYQSRPSQRNSRLLHQALLAVAGSIAVCESKDLTLGQSGKEARLAAKHCMVQIGLGKYQPREDARFSTWACKVMRNKIIDPNRRIQRAEQRKLREQAKREARKARKAARLHQLDKRKYQTAFTPADVAVAIKRLRPNQAELLRLKSRTPRLQDIEIASKLGLNRPQLHNRWSRLRRKVKRLLAAEIKRERLVSRVRQRWYPGAPCVYASDRGQGVKGRGQAIAGIKIAIGQD